MRKTDDRIRSVDYFVRNGYLPPTGRKERVRETGGRYVAFVDGVHGNVLPWTGVLAPNGADDFDHDRLRKALTVPLPLQDELNNAVLKCLFEQGAAMMEKAVCDAVFEHVRFTLGNPISYSALQDRVGTQGNNYLDGLAILEWAALKLMNDSELTTFASFPTFKWRMQWAYKVLEKHHALLLRHTAKKSRRVLTFEYWKLLGR